jgi:hypothetical protein
MVEDEELDDSIDELDGRSLRPSIEWLRPRITSTIEEGKKVAS